MHPPLAPRLTALNRGLTWFPHPWHSLSHGASVPGNSSSGFRPAAAITLAAS